MAVGTSLDSTDTRGGSTRSQRVRLTLLLVAIGIATVLVPPLLLGRGTGRTTGSPPSAGAVGPPVTLTGAPATALASGLPPLASSGPPVPSASAPPPSASASVSAAARVFAPISVQAEAPGNTLIAGADVVDCATCDGGARVRYVGGDNKLVVSASVPVAGSRTISVVYECDGSRTVRVTVNNGNPIVMDVSGPDWTTPRTVTFTATVPAGQVKITFYNDGPAPDIDKVTLS